MPIMSSTGKVLGTIGTYFRERREPTSRERQVVEVLCRTAASRSSVAPAEEAAARSGDRMELVRAQRRGRRLVLPVAVRHADLGRARQSGTFTCRRTPTVTIDTFYERLHPDDRERTRAAIARSIAARTPYDIDYRTVSPDGRRRNGSAPSAERSTTRAASRLGSTASPSTSPTASRERRCERQSRTLASLNATNLALALATDTETIVQTATDAATLATRAAVRRVLLQRREAERRAVHALHALRRAALGVRASFRCRATRPSSRPPSAAKASSAPTTSRRTRATARTRRTTACRRATCRCAATSRCR